jgi:hypothetical protein
MSAIRYIAWGMVDIETLSVREYYDMVQAIKADLSPHCIQLWDWKKVHPSLMGSLVPVEEQGWTLKLPNRGRKRRYTGGPTLQDCCKRALEIIEGEHHA